MCTLSIAPDGLGGFNLVSNRDESRNRSSATLPQCHRERGYRVLMPIDPQGGGSWIGLSDEGRAACLLNGAREAHESMPPYAKSRGLVLKDSFAWENPREFLENYPLKEIPPERLSIELFTLVLLGIEPSPWIEVLRWNGEEREIEQLAPDKPQVLSATKLYSKDSIKQTEERFKGFMEQSSDPPTLEELKRFNEGERYRLKMEKAGESPVEELDTLSTTALSFGPERLRMEFLDIRNNVEAAVEMAS